MAISDSLPERRNLVVAAAAFIVFYAGGGNVVDPVVRLAVVNVNFHRPEALAAIAWTMLFWFQLRFWQSTRRKFSEKFRAEIYQWSVPRRLAKRAAELAESQAQQKGIKIRPGYTIEAFAPELNGRNLSMACNFKYIENGTKSGENQQRVTFQIPLLQFLSLWLMSFLRSLASGNAVAEYVFPYVLFLAALSGPVWSRML